MKVSLLQEKLKISNRFIIWSFQAVIVALTAFSFGFSWGNVGNQYTYMIHPLSILKSGFAIGDWLTYETCHYHPRFTYFIIAISKIAPVPWAAAFANTVLIVIALWLIIDLVRFETDSKEITIYALCLIFSIIWVTKTWFAGQSYIFSDGLQPSAISTTFFIASITYYLRGETKKSGLFLSFAAFFHANFLVLGISVFGFANMLQGKMLIWRRLAWQLGPSLLVLSIDLPMLISAAGGSSADEARYIFQNIRSPFHYLPFTFISNANVGFLWISLGILSILRMPKNRFHFSAMPLMLALSLPVITGYLFTTVVFVPAISQIFVWRLLPFAIMITITIQSINSVKNILGHQKVGLLELIECGVCVLIFILSLKGVLPWGYRLTVVIPLVGYVGRITCDVINRVLRVHLSKDLVAVLISVTLMLWAGQWFLLSLHTTISDSYLLSPDKHKEKLDLYQWAQNTPIGTRFMVPPSLREFRLMSQRAVIVDWSNTPAFGEGVVEWYRRISVISGKKINSSNEAEECYKNMSIDKLIDIQKIYKVDYAIFKRGKNSFETIQRMDIVFANDEFIVIKLI